MTLIKLLLVAAFLGLFVWAFRNRARVGLRAGARIAMFVFTAMAVASILWPNITQVVADFLGVTRGTDLVLYALVVAFFVTSVGSYFRFREQDRKLVEVVRANAIREAILTQGVPGAGGRADVTPAGR
jgi:small membrane protein